MAYLPLMTQMNSPTSAFTGSPPAAANPNIAAGRWFDPARTEEIIRVNGGYELKISPLYKRFIAEVIDTVILFVVKILFFVVILDFFDVHM